MVDSGDFYSGNVQFKFWVSWCLIYLGAWLELHALDGGT